MTKPSGSSESSTRPADSPVKPAAESPAETERMAAAEGASTAGAASTSGGRRRIDRRIAVALLGLLVIVGVVGTLVLPRFFAAKSTTTIWQNITSGITDGTVPKQTALEAFAYLFKVSIPGVTVPGGVDGSDVPTSGSGAMRWVRANWDSLTSDQQAVINRYATPGPNDEVMSVSPVPTASPAPTPTPSPVPTDTPSPTPTETPSVSPSPATDSAAPSASTSSSPAPGDSASSAAQAQPIFRLVSARMTSGPGPIAAPKAPTTLKQAMFAEIQTDIAHLGPKLGMSVIPNGFPLPNVTLELSSMSGGNVLFLTQALDKWLTFGGKDVSGPYYTPCNITAYAEAWQNEAMTSGGGVSPRLHVLISHEVIHCYQNVVWGDSDTANSIAPWITEGTAAYLAADDTKIIEPLLPGAWTIGYFTPEIALTNRTYDAVGFYSYLAQHGRNMWGTMLQAWQAAAKGPDRSNAFIAVWNGDDPNIRNNWAESYLRSPDWGEPWKMSGFGLTDATAVVQHPAQAQSDPGWLGTLLGRSNTVLNVASSAGEVVNITTDGLASVHDSSGNSALAFQSQRFCTISGGCVCPQGTLEAGKNVAPANLTLPFVAAFNAPFGGSKYNILGEKMDDLCKRPPTPQPKQGSPCGPNCTNSNGDPHMLTVNLYRYDFQAAGEFTLLRSKDGSLEIQARQEPWGTAKSVATNTAIAAKVGSHRVAIYSGAKTLTAKVDGKTVDLTSPMDLGGGGRISTYTNGFEIDFPDGTKMWTLAVPPWGINAQISPSATLRASGVGLLGPVVPGGLGVPALPDGTQLPVAADRHARHDVLYGQYADAWRVTDSTTLFDYDSGKSTATYTIKGYPADTADITAADLTPAQTSAGEAACGGVTDADLHDECVFDVGVTGETGFAGGYQAVQTFQDLGIVKATPGPAASVSYPAASPRPGTIDGAFKTIQAQRLVGYAIGPDNTVYISAQIDDTHSTLLAIDPNSGKIVKQVDIPAATQIHIAGGSLWLPGLATDPDGGHCNVVRYDAATLVQGVTLKIPCGPYGVQIVSDGSAAWFEDTTKWDYTTDKGAVLTRIDPTTNAFGPSVDVPYLNGYHRDSQGALFWFDTGAGKSWYRLTTGATAMESMGQFKYEPIPAGTGLWVQSDDQKSAQYYTTAGTPQVTLPINGGTVVGGDTTAAFIQITGENAAGTAAAEQLWRYPIDGSAPVMISYSPTINSENYNYFSDPPPMANGNGVAKIWATLIDSTNVPWIVVQWVPVK